MKNYKKLIFLIMAFVLILTFVGCGSKDSKKTSPDADTTTVSDIATDTDEQLESLKETGYYKCIDVADQFIEDHKDDPNSTWNSNTHLRTESFILYTPSDEYCGFYIYLKTDDKSTGYIQVMFFDDGDPFIESYSFEDVDIGYRGDCHTIYIGDGEFLRKKENEDFYRSTKTAATYTAEEVETKFNELKAKYK